MEHVIKRIFLAMLLSMATLTTASATVINSLSGVVVNGTEYNAYFHAGKSYNDIWGGASSLLNRDPMFLNDRKSARRAVFRIAYLMDSKDQTEPGTDRMIVPFSLSGTSVYGFVDTDPSAGDIFTIGSTNVYSREGPFNHPYVSFELAQVPVPAALYLFISGLAGLGLIAKNRKLGPID